MAISKEKFSKIRKKYGKTSSFAIWEKYNPSKMSPKDGISDLSIFDDANIYKKLNDKYIFIALNGSSHKTNNKSFDWANFHSDDKKRQQDFKLRYALQNTKFWGSYITDFFLCEETDSKKVIKKAKNKAFLDRNIKRLRDELNFINKNAILIAIGTTCRRFLRNNFSETNKVYDIMHYANYISKENYKKAVAKSLKNV